MGEGALALLKCAHGRPLLGVPFKNGPMGLVSISKILHFPMWIVRLGAFFAKALSLSLPLSRNSIRSNSLSFRPLEKRVLTPKIWFLSGILLCCQSRVFGHSCGHVCSADGLRQNPILFRWEGYSFQKFAKVLENDCLEERGSNPVFVFSFTNSICQNFLI